MISNIIRFFFLFCLIFSNSSCLQKSVIKTHVIGNNEGGFSNSNLVISVYIRASKNNTNIRVVCDKKKAMNLARIEVNGTRLFKNEEYGNFIEFTYSTTSFQEINNLAITTDDGNVRKEYALNIPINPLDFATEQISNFDRNQINYLQLSRIYDEKETPWLEYIAFSSIKQRVLFNETKDYLIILPKVTKLLSKGKRDILLHDFKKGNGISDDELVFVYYETLYESQIELDIVH